MAQYGYTILYLKIPFLLEIQTISFLAVRNFDEHLGTYTYENYAIFGMMYRKICFITGDPDSMWKQVDNAETNVHEREWKESTFL